jgi:D-glycero-D-manno-heptose 1,7-bisphosphate phosphatase
MSTPARPAVFLDRDGTLNDELGFLTEPAGLTLYPGVADALGELTRAGFALIVVTNQSGVARGLLDEAQLDRIHDRLHELVGEGGAILDRIEYCPHHPEEGREPYRRACACRKPAPGLVLRAAAELGLDLDRSYLIGDAERDLVAGLRAGVGKLILVETGKGADTRAALAGSELGDAVVAPDLPAAVRWILANGAHQSPGAPSDAGA